MKTTLGIEFEPFFPQISHRAKIGCAKYDLSTGEGVAMEQWYLNMGEVPGTPLSQIVGIYSNVKPYALLLVSSFIKTIEHMKFYFLRHSFPRIGHG